MSGARPKIRPKNGLFCYVPFLGLIFWVTFCSNSNALTFDSKVYVWNKMSGEKIIVIDLNSKSFTFTWCSHKNISKILIIHFCSSK